MAGEAEQTPEPQVVQPIPVVYFNAVTAHATAYEMALDLGLRTGDGAPEVAVRAVTTWEHAKSVRALLDRMIARYEEQVGSIRDIEPQTKEEAQDDAPDG
jgi:uncharacterized protein DUF3467